jgi:hypothetical protein
VVWSRYYPAITLQGMWKTTENLKMASVPTEIRIKYHPKTIAAVVFFNAEGLELSKTMEMKQCFNVLTRTTNITV